MSDYTPSIEEVGAAYRNYVYSTCPTAYGFDAANAEFARRMDIEHEKARKPLADVIARVEALHERIGASWPHNGGVYVCRADGGIWPCQTVRALTEGEPSE